MKFDNPVGRITITIGGGKIPNEVMIRFMSPVPDDFKLDKCFRIGTECDFMLFEEDENGCRLHNSGSTKSNTRISISNKILADRLKEYNTEYEFTIYKNHLLYFVYLKENNDIERTWFFQTRNKKRQNSDIRRVSNLELADKADIVLRYANGHSTSEIADKVQRSYQTVKRTIDQNTNKAKREHIESECDSK